MRLSSAAIVGILLGLALMLSACGEDGTSAAGTGTGGKATTEASAVATPRAEAARARRSCRRQLRGFVGSMAELRDELARGLSYDDYLAEVRSVRATYARIDAGRLAAGCLLASGGPAERAFNLYIDAANSWGDCLATASCNTRSIEPELQRKWALAARQLTVARQGSRPG